jgi:hypothetical protein
MHSYLGKALDAQAGHQKEAFGLGALGGHLATNAINRAAHQGTNIAEVMAHHGLQHGLLQQGMTGGGLRPGTSAFLKLMYGPEALMHYEAANKAGRALVNHFPNPQDRQRAIQALVGGTGAVPGLERVPVGGEVLKALQHELHGGQAPELAREGVSGAVGGLLASHLNRAVSRNGRTGMETGTQKAMDLAANGLPLAAAASTGLGAEHMAVNGARWAGSKLFGRQMAESGFRKGLRGELPGQASQFLIDHLVSPAILDPQRAGHQLRQMTPQGSHALLDEATMHDWASPEGRAQGARALKPLVAAKVNPLLQRLHGAAQAAPTPGLNPGAVAAGAAVPMLGYAAYQALQPKPQPEQAPAAQPQPDPGQLATVLPFPQLKAAALKDQTRVCRNCQAEGATAPRALCDECKCKHGPRMNEPCRGCGREKR